MVEIDMLYGYITLFEVMVHCLHPAGAQVILVILNLVKWQHSKPDSGRFVIIWHPSSPHIKSLIIPIAHIAFISYDKRTFSQISDGKNGRNQWCFTCSISEFAQLRPHLFARYIPNILPPCREEDLEKYIEETRQMQRDLRTHPEFIW